MYRLRTRLKNRAVHYVKCAAKTGTFLFFASLYLFVMKLTIFKSDKAVIREIETLDQLANDTRWNTWATDYKESKTESILQNMTEKQYLSLLTEYDARVRRMQETCDRYNLTNRGRINNKEFFIADSHGIIWCNIFKAASSSWMYNLNILGGYSERFLSRTHQSPLILARKKFPRPAQAVLLKAYHNPNYFSFLIVREPFERLLSGYRDKIENFGPPYYRKLSRQIIHKYRNNKSDNNNKGPTFYEFVKYITDNYKTFKEQFEFDEHWTPYYKFCTPCLLNFKMVVKVETLHRDNEFIIRELGLTEMLFRQPIEKKTRVKTIMNKSRDGRSTRALLRVYFQEIDKEMLNDLLDIYKIDFEMFGYDASVYYEYVSE